MVVQASNHIKTAAHARGGVPKCPCDNVSRWAMEPADKITGISIGAASCVNSIKITFDIDGTTRVTPRYGGPGGELFQACLSDLHPSMHLFFCLPLPPINTCYQIYKSLNFSLMQDEYLTSVSGYVKHDCSEFPCVSQLTFTTNLGKTYGPYGGGGGTFFEVNVEYDEIKGFFGHATEEYLTAFGVYLIRRLPGVFYYFIFIKELVRVILFYSFIMHLCFSRKTIGLRSYLIKGLTSNTMSLIFQAKLVKLDFVDDTFPHPQFFDRLECWKVLVSNSNLIKFMLMELTRGGGGIDAYDLVDMFHRHRDSKLGFVSSGIWHILFEIQSIYVLTNRLTMHPPRGFAMLSQHHVDSKYSEMLSSCISKEAFDVVIFYVYFEKGSTPTPYGPCVLPRLVPNMS
ncbi:unnamed protein product [Musa banksii]